MLLKPFLVEDKDTCSLCIQHHGFGAVAMQGVRATEANVVPFSRSYLVSNRSDSKVHRANLGPIWGLQDPGGPHVGPMNFAIWEVNITASYFKRTLFM